MKRRGNGAGTIFKRKDNRWSAETFVTLPNGLEKRVSKTSKSYETVRVWLRETKDRENKKIPYVEQDWTVAKYLDYWMEDVQPKRVRETTLAAYKMLIRCHIKPVLGGHKLRSMSVQDVRNAMANLEKKWHSGRTRQKCLQVLSACLTNAMREELLYRNVAQLVEKPKHTPKETVIWTTEQAARFLQETSGHPHYIAFLLFLTYGLRRGEVLGLRYEDIDFDNNLIYIRQQIDRIDGRMMARDVKTMNSRRTLPLTADVRIELVRHAKKNGVGISSFKPRLELSTKGTVVSSKVGTPLEPRNLTRCFEALTKQAGLPRIKVHAMRHTAATMLKDLHVPVKDAQLILGHSSISTTLNIYQHGTADTHRAAISAMGSRLLCR